MKNSTSSEGFISSGYVLDEDAVGRRTRKTWRKRLENDYGLNYVIVLRLRNGKPPIASVSFKLGADTVEVSREMATFSIDKMEAFFWRVYCDLRFDPLETYPARK